MAKSIQSRRLKNGILSLFLLLFLALGVWALTGCQDEIYPVEPLPPYSTCLTELLPFGHIETDSLDVEFGTQEAEALLVEGWSVESNDKGAWTGWGIGNQSTLQLNILSPRDLDIILEGFPLLFEGAPDQIVEVVLNGASIDKVRLKRSWEPREYHVTLPGKKQVLGKNLLELRYTYNRRPCEVLPGSEDNRSLAVAWTSIRLDGHQVSSYPMADTLSAESALILPNNTSVNYYVKSPEGGMLTIDSVVSWGESGKDSHNKRLPVLQIAFATADGPEEPDVHMYALAELTEGVSLRVPSTGGGPIRIGFVSVPGEHPFHGDAGLRLLRPMLHTHTHPLGGSGDKADEEPQIISRPTSDSPRRPNILIYLVDALRADHLGCYGYPKPTSPNIDAFAEDATLFTSMVAQSSWTRSSVASIFSGLYCSVHGINDTHDALPNSLEVLPQILGGLGYETAGLISNANIDSVFGFGRGFESYELQMLPSKPLNELAFDWFERRSQELPFFLYLHTLDPHSPYTPPFSYRFRFALAVADSTVGTMKMLKALSEKEIESTNKIARELAALYDAEIALNDAAFGALIHRLKELDLYDSTLIIFVSDHGEEFLDHGRWQHGQTLFAEQLHVPLIIKFPGHLGRGVRVPDTARQIDILPTLLDYLDESPPAEVQGRSLLPFISPGKGGQQQVETFAMISREGFEAETVLSHGKKLIRNLDRLRDRPEFELYDLDLDPLETENLINAERIWFGYLRSRLKFAKDQWIKRAHEPEEASLRDVKLDEKIRRELQALGYM